MTGKTNARDRLIAALAEAGPAHHRAYQETDGLDPDWPWWYAGFLRERLNQILGVELTRSEWTYWLIAAARHQTERGLETPWPDVYADYFLSHIV